MDNVDWGYQFLLACRLVFGIIAFILLCFTLIHPAPLFIVSVFLVVISPLILRKFSKSSELKTYPYLLITIVLIVVSLLKLCIQNPNEINTANTDASEAKLTVEQEKQANYARLRSEGKAERTKDPKAMKAYIRGQEDTIEAEVCNSVRQNLEKVEECSAHVADNGKVLLYVKYQYQSSFGFDDNERTLAFKLSSVLHSLYNSSHRFHTVKFVGFADMTDKYGKTENAPYAKVLLEEREAYKLNWKVDSVMLPEYLPNVWQLTGPVTNANRS